MKLHKYKKSYQVQLNKLAKGNYRYAQNRGCDISFDEYQNIIKTYFDNHHDSNYIEQLCSNYKWL